MGFDQLKLHMLHILYWEVHIEYGQKGWLLIEIRTVQAEAANAIFNNWKLSQILLVQNMYLIKKLQTNNLHHLESALAHKEEHIVTFPFPLLFVAIINRKLLILYFG